MASRTKKTRTTKKSTPRLLGIFDGSPALILLKLAIVVVAIGFLAWLLFFVGGSRHSGNADEVKQRLQTTLQAIQLPGKQLALNVEDQGCSSKSSVGLQKRINCYVEGYGYFEIAADAKTALQFANSKLEELGFQRVDNKFDDQVLDGSREGDVYYLNHHEHTNARLGWSSLPEETSRPKSNLVSRALSSNKIDPDADATVVGVKVDEGYWSCTNGGLFSPLGLNCAFPPHSPDRN